MRPQFFKMNPLKHSSIFLFILVLLSCDEAEQKVVETPKGDEEKVAAITDSTTQSIQQLLQSYYALKDALVAADSAKAALLSERLAQQSDSINLSSSQQKDEALYASVKALPGTIKTAALSLAQAKKLDAQRTIFETVSDNMYELVKTIKPSGITTYQQYCPMAFGDEGASWLSDSAQINNPYLGVKHPTWGNKMLHCGEVKETLNFQ